MITAREAHEKTDWIVKNPSLVQIEEEIMKAISKGKYSLEFRFLHQSTEEKLKKLGYNVSHWRHYNGYEIWRISW